jgi:hypothetical protein
VIVVALVPHASALKAVRQNMSPPPGSTVTSFPTLTPQPWLQTRMSLCDLMPYTDPPPSRVQRGRTCTVLVLAMGSPQCVSQPV